MMFILLYIKFLATHIHSAVLDSLRECTIYELGSTQHINRVDTLKIGNHVWVGWHASIWKNVCIADDCIIGAYAVVTKSFSEPHCAIAGNPARVVRRNITWEHAYTEEYIENSPLARPCVTISPTP